jgi:hypothetical protein
MVLRARAAISFFFYTNERRFIAREKYRAPPTETISFRVSGVGIGFLLRWCWASPNGSSMVLTTTSMSIDLQCSHRVWFLAGWSTVRAQAWVCSFSFWFSSLAVFGRLVVFFCPCNEGFFICVKKKKKRKRKKKKTSVR